LVVVRGYGGVLDGDPYRSWAIVYADGKTVSPEWHMTILRGLSAIWPPTSVFVALDIDHVTTNMFFIPLAIWLNDLKIGVCYYIWKSTLLALRCEIIDGGLSVAVVYW
ncbi:hypothetical protein DOTSEDRAFT_115346, partial [Dothistroma septosporum NZE10]